MEQKLDLKLRAICWVSLSGNSFKSLHYYYYYDGRFLYVYMNVLLMLLK